MLANELLKQIPEANIKYVKKDEDPRDYKVSFEKIKKNLNFEQILPEPILLPWQAQYQ